MIEFVTRLTLGHRKAVLIGSFIFLIVAGAVGGSVSERLSTGGFEPADSEAHSVADLLKDKFDAGNSNLIFLVTAKSGNVDDPAVVEAGRLFTTRLAADPDVAQAESYFTLGAPPLKSNDGTAALVLARIEGTQDEIDDVVGGVVEKFEMEDGVIATRAGGYAPVFHQVGKTIESDLIRAESIAIPITLILLVIVFGSVVSASMPLGVGVFAILGTFLVLRILSEITQVSVYSLNMTTSLGLGLAIDYALFVVSRFREERGRGQTVDDAVRTTIATAGRTVVFSAVTVAISLSVLLLFPLPFLRSFAYAGIPVVFLAMTGAVLCLPALLAVLGPRVEKFKVRHVNPGVSETGMWHSLALGVMKRPWPIAVVIVAVLVGAGIPFLNVKFGLPDDRVLPKDLPARQSNEIIREKFPSAEAFPVNIVLNDIGDPQARTTDVETYARRVSKLDGVARVDTYTGFFADGEKVLGPLPRISDRFVRPDGAWMSAVLNIEPVSPEAEEIVHALRANTGGFDVSVGGSSAELVDGKKAVFDRVPLAGLLIGLITFFVLFLVFGSIVVPLKAVALNLLSLTATFGAMVWIFQEGHLSGLLGFTPTGFLDTTTPILMFCIAFGLSMDYEVFLLSRIREEWDATGDNEHSVAVGLEKTGRIVTAAALLISTVFIATATSGITFIKLFGIGMTLAVVMDATIVRALLVPAFMKLAGDANWWLPGPLRTFWEKYGISEGGQSPVSVAAHREVPALAGRDPWQAEEYVTTPNKASGGDVGSLAEGAEELTVSELRSRLGEVLDSEAGSTFVVTKRGVKTAVIITLEEE